MKPEPKDEISGGKEYLTNSRYSEDVYKGALWVLGLVAGFSVIGIIILAGFDRPNPDGLVAMGSAAIGGIVGIFASSSKD